MNFFPIPKSKDCLVSNLEWDSLNKMTSGFFGHERIDQMIADGGRWFFRYTNGADDNYGVTKEADLEDYKGQTLVTVAGLVATHPLFRGSSILVMLKNDIYDDGMGFAVGLWNGNVRIDRPFRLTQAKEIVREFEVISRGRPYQTWGDILDLANAKPFSLKALLATKGSGKRLKIEPLRSEKGGLIFIIVIVCLIVLLCAYWAWDWYDSSQKETLELVRQAQKSPDIVYEKAVKLRLSSPVLIAKDVLPDLVEQINRFPISLGGWKLATIHCKGVECEAQWKSAGGTYDEFKKQANPDWGTIALANTEAEVLGDLKTIRHSFRLELKTSTLPDKSSWQKRDDFQLSTGVSWQRLGQFGWAASLSPMAQQAIPDALPTAAIKNHKSAIFAMPWIAKDQNWLIAQKAIGEMPQSVTLENFSLAIKEKERSALFSGSGLAYVQN